MAARLKEDENVFKTSLSVRPEGFDRLVRAIENPKAPTEKLVEMMRYRNSVKAVSSLKSVK